MDEIKKQIIDFLREAGVKGEIDLSIPPKPEMGDLAFACFNIAKEWKMSPPEAAKKIQTQLLTIPHAFLTKVEVFGPYVNFFLNPGTLAEIIIKDVEKSGKKFGVNKIGKGKKIIVEYPSNNTHKELHIGHLRNMSIGNALVEIFEASGYKAIPINYLNDFGAHVAKCLWGLKKFHAKEKPPTDKQKWLGEIYAEASKYLKEHEELKPEVDEIQRQLENKEKSILGLYEKTRKWSIEGFAEIFDEMGVKNSSTFYESDVKQAGQKMVDELLKKNIAQIGEGGAIIIDLTKFGLDIGLLRKSNGAGLYLTSDLGLAVAKNKKYPKIDESIHITGSEQIFYFKQLFKILDLAGYHYKMTHIPYGMVSRPEGKMSSRLGNVVLYDELRNEVYGAVIEEVKSRHTDWSKKKIASNALTIALAAIKFDFLKHESMKNIVFDPKSATSFDGFTGPYVLYTVARINSILKKSKISNLKSKIDYDLLASLEEKQVVMLLGEFGEVIEKSLKNYNPSVIVKYSFDLAKAYNDFYNKLSVLNAESKELTNARLAFSLAVRQVIQNALALLTIETVQEM